jgi:hypothetical protein
MKMLRFGFALVATLAFVAACSSDRRGGGGDGKHDLSTLGGPGTDGGSIYNHDLGDVDSGSMCTAGKMPNSCANPIGDSAGCGPTELCGTDGSGNGLDDNCDGHVDENCPCTPGNVEKCFAGPPGKHDIGACTDGTATCQGTEFGAWGPCVGSIGPSAEVCDGTDNDCNGCADDGLCCGNTLTCPTTVPDVQPYTNVTYPGSTYFTGPATSWTWKVTGGPCDQLFETTTGSPPAQSFTVTNGTTSTPTANYTLSGDYTIVMTATENGASQTCTFVQHVAGPGIRFELCWDTTGKSDLDLHLHKPNSTTNFFGTTSDYSTAFGDDCNYNNCKGSSDAGSITPSWGYGTSPLANCSGDPDGEGLAWTLNGSCRNPRLDVDDIIDIGVPENANVDKPNNGDTFRALVHYYGIDTGASTLTSHPMVNIYCGGKIKATYGQAPDVVTGFATAGAWAMGNMWRVADVAAIVNASGVTTDCTVTALHPGTTTTGYRVGSDSSITYEGQ